MEPAPVLMDDAKELEQKLSFQCIVRGRPLTATVTHRLNYEVVMGYRIQFSDGYVSEFYVEVDGWYQSGKEEKPDSYFFAIRKDLKDLLHFEIYAACWCFRTAVEGVQTNVFVIYDNSEEFGKRYKVRYNGDYQFTLVKKEKKWFAGNDRKGGKEPSAELARNISLLIESVQ